MPPALFCLNSCFAFLVVIPEGNLLFDSTTTKPAAPPSPRLCFYL